MKLLPVHPRMLRPLCAILLVTLSGCGYYPGETPSLPFAEALNRSTVFVGDSITHLWQLPINNQGISGMTTSRMLHRFRSVVVGFGYKRVVILGGTNDIWHVGATQSETISNLQAMATIAHDAGLEVALCTLPPLHPQGEDLDPQVVALNAAIRQLAAEHKYLLVDYYTPMSSSLDGLFKDGVHPTDRGYALMETALATEVKQ